MYALHVCKGTLRVSACKLKCLRMEEKMLVSMANKMTNVDYFDIEIGSHDRPRSDRESQSARASSRRYLLLFWTIISNTRLSNKVRTCMLIPIAANVLFTP